MNQRVHSVDNTRRAEMRRHHAKLLLLSDVCRIEAQIRTETNDPDSLQATSTGENIRQGLVHMTDTAYTFMQGENTNHFVLDNVERTRFLVIE